ncbi:MAG: YHYH protein [Proteobacteria bacterium]|nr:YHYH protein [Pseudomonadota bacterium]
MRLHLLAALAALLAAPALAHEADLTRLPLGDGKISTEPKVGFIWACRIDPNAGGAFRNGPWIKDDGTYDFTRKAVVPGDVHWPSRYSMRLEGDNRVFSLNDLPSHGTGVFPIPADSEAYRYDRNPNRIEAHDLDVVLPANPVPAPQPSCAPGAVGILLSGAVLFNALDAPGRDAVAHETQDKCQGHPQESGVYHYHSISTCIDDKRLPDGHSALVGYALDGFGIYGRYGEGGKLLSSADLDACHGHTHMIEWDGKRVMMYHYHATWDFPYTVGCLRGTWSFKNMMTISGGPPRHRGFGPFGPP